jgi:anti-sigma regulatory factor (Ser/Thr protein kinase)
MSAHAERRDLGFCEVSFEKRPELVSIVRRFVSDFYDRTLADPEATSRVALATHELLENAVKYSRDGRAKVRIEVSGRGEKVRVRIRTRNDR